MLDLDAIEARANAATPGPWKYCADSDAIKGTNALIVRGARSNSGPFIASARTDVPALIARVRELEAQLRIERENVAELEERLVLCQRTNDRMRERIGVKPPPWGMNK